MENKVKLITDEHIWMEHTAIEQLTNTARLQNIEMAAGLPDLHAGKMPIGAAFLVKNRIYPHIIGNDIGCGMSLLQTGIKKKQYKQKRWTAVLNTIRDLGELEKEVFQEAECPIRDFGTLGGGNHFAEFQMLEAIEKEEAFLRTGLDKDEILLLVHSGSRGYGQQIYTRFSNPEGFLSDSAEGKAYLKLHEDALYWAKRNRKAVAEKLMRKLGFQKEPVAILDCPHNFIQQQENFFLHRKGAVSGQVQLAVIPGSRGTLTYLVKPGKRIADSLYSFSHGAGRKWARALCMSRIKKKYEERSIRETQWKSQVICHDRKLLYEEAPEAYKNIQPVIDCLVKQELIEVIAVYKPLITFKG